MPFIPNTPESLLPRSDSKNPATTCKGITESGRPCRRSLALSPTSSPLPKLNRHTKNGVLAVLPGNSEHEGAAAFFCWQHKDQAATLQSRESNTPGRGNRKTTTLLPLTERTSIDTLVDRLGVLDVQDEHESGRRKKPKRASRPVRKETLPQNWQEVQGPLMALPHEGSSSTRPSPGKKRHRPGFWESLCCIDPAYESTPPPRVRPQKSSTTTPETTTVPTSVRPPSAQTPATPQRPSASSPPPLTTPVSFPNRARRTSSHTQTLLALIPPSLSPQTTSALLSELAKPVSQHDEEGWIYIFWLTPNASTESDPNAVTSLLNAPQSPGRRNSSAADTGKTILLKIGRASNVQRRMNEWTRQCGYDLSLVRFYPYLQPSTSPLPSPSHARHSRATRDSSQAPTRATAPHKVPHAHKVERLIHLELAEQRVKKDCEACGKEHREWFEVRGTREGVKAVDEVVRRWVGWAEGTP